MTTGWKQGSLSPPRAPRSREEILADVRGVERLNAARLRAWEERVAWAHKRWLATGLRTGAAAPYVPRPRFDPLPADVGELRCGARRTRDGEPCRQLALGRGWRCRFHGGESTGPRTPEGLAAVRANLAKATAASAEAARRRAAERRAAEPGPGRSAALQPLHALPGAPPGPPARAPGLLPEQPQSGPGALPPLGTAGARPAVAPPGGPRRTR
jgi:hypothetical protein